MKLILASGSPRRSEILKNAGYEFVVKPTSADESLPGGILPEDAVKLLSERKADAAKIECSDVVLSADTVVALGDRILGKPSDKAEAFSMLRSLSGKTHSVYTGVTIKSAEKKRVFAVKTDVLFYPLTDDEINAYIATGDPFDKAGAYGIQGRAAVFVEKIDGDYYSVVGLPLRKSPARLRHCAEHVILNKLQQQPFAKSETRSARRLLLLQKAPVRCFFTVRELCFYIVLFGAV